MKKQLFILSMFLCIISCCPTQVVTSTNRVENSAFSERNTAIERDSIYVHFTDTVKIVQKGDTITNEVIKWRTQYQIKTVHDTLIIRDTIRITEIEKVVETKLQRIPFYKRIEFFIVLCCGAVLLFAIGRRML